MAFHGDHCATVSTIIPVFNGRDDVAKAIESALAQTHCPQEVIVVDDGSTDDTAHVVDKYPVKYVYQTNAGPGAARNLGAQFATGEWFAFLDHDDTWHPEKTEQQLRYGSGSEVGVVYCALKKLDQVSMTWDHLWARNIIGTPSGTLVRRQCFWDVGGFDCRRCLIGAEDHHLWMRIALTKWRFARCQTRVFNYAPREQSLSNQFLQMARAEWASCEDIRHRAALSDNTLQRKKIAIANHYIREFIGKRDLAGARALISTIGARHVKPDLLFGSFSPDWVLKLRKAMRAQAREIVGLR